MVLNIKQLLQGFVYDGDEWMIRGWVVSVIECLVMWNLRTLGWSILIIAHDLQ